VDGAAASIDALLGFASAVGSRVEVVLDRGVPRGAIAPTHALKPPPGVRKLAMTVGPYRIPAPFKEMLDSGN
jgi:hypothetical protein